MKVMHLLLVAAAGLACDDASATSAAGIGVSCDLGGVRVSPATVTMTVGDTARVTAVEATCSSALPVPFAVFWRSSNAQVASVDSSTGTVRALGAGQTTIIALVVNDTLVKGAAVVNVSAR